MGKVDVWAEAKREPRWIPPPAMFGAIYGYCAPDAIGTVAFFVLLLPLAFGFSLAIAWARHGDRP